MPAFSIMERNRGIMEINKEKMEVVIARKKQKTQRDIKYTINRW